MRNLKPLLLLAVLFFPSLIFAQPSKFTEPEIVLVEGGEFVMGCSSIQNPQCISDQQPSVRISLYDFWIGKYEVTNAQYAEFLNHRGNLKEGGTEWYKMDKYSLIQEDKDGLFLSKKGFENFPVTNVSWFGAKAYTEWLSEQTGTYYRLPTEAEWEYAARGGQKSKGYVYSGSNNPEEVGWFYDFAANSKTGWNFKNDVGTHPVGQKMGNELGIHDMSGNLSEWCWDIYENYYTAGINPMGSENGSLRVLRGGSWDHQAKEYKVSARNSSQHVGNFSVNKGFRVVMEKDISNHIDSIATENDFNGTILVSKKGKTIYHQSFGLADRERNVPIKNDTQFAIASITKLFTAVIILQLVEEGKIDLNKSISHYLPDYKGLAGDKVNIHHLLTHTSGIQNSEDIKSIDIRLPEISVNKLSTNELLEKYSSGNQITKSGTIFSYNNAEYIILGKIIEEITNDSYQNVLKKRILQPLEMLNSDLITNENTPNDLAQGYTWDRKLNVFTKNPKILFQNYYAAGAMYSTTSDLMVFSQALYGGKLINDHSLKLLLTTYPETRSYGYGLWVSYPQYNRTVPKVSKRYGRIWGVNTLISYFHNHDITVVVLANTDKVSVSDFQDIVGEQILN